MSEQGGERVSRRVVRAVAPFGITPERGGARPEIDEAALSRLIRLEGGEVALVTGPSGSGKSSLVCALHDRLRRRGERVCVVNGGAFARSGRAVVDVVGGSLGRAMGALAGAGLGEAGLLARAAGALSDGERWRLRLARAMVEAGDGRAWVVADEFCSTLDRVTGESVAASLRRWAHRHGGVRVVCAAAHEDLEKLLRADLVVRFGTDGACALVEGTAQRRAPQIEIDRGEIADYDALGDHHYRGGRPATWTRVLRAHRRTAHGRVLAGALVVSRPTLNAAWRDLPWPGRYTTGSLRERARRINEELRCISRVVVEPRSRGMGIARRLVGAYLHEAETPATEALAAMGAVCPFFERAGMRAYRPGVLAADARLLDALAHAGLGAEELLVGSRAREAAGDAFVRRELKRWANASRATRALLEVSWGEMARAAGVRLASRVVGYAHVAGA